MDGIEVTEIAAFGSTETVRWTVACLPCQAGRSVGSEEDLNIWIAAHLDARHGEGG